MSAQFNIEHIGPLVSIQDSGRHGYMRYGVTGAGPMDRLSHALGHLSLGNVSLNSPSLQTPSLHSQAEKSPPLNSKAQQASIEVSLGGLSLRCIDGSTTVAVTGGHFDVRLDGKSMPPWCRLEMQAGSLLSIRPGAWGSWCYVAFTGNIVSESWLGSQSMIVNSDLCGRALQQNDTLQIESTTQARPKTTSDSTSDSVSGALLDPASLKPDSSIRIVPGPQDRFFNEESLHDLHTKPFTLTAEYNRMGVRLSGPTLSINSQLNMPSAPITRGSIQVPGHGDPICLLADHQTTGGYPKIATIISADQDKLAQLRSGDTVTFTICDASAAVTAARERRALLEALTTAMNQTSLDERLWTSNLISGVVNADADGNRD